MAEQISATVLKLGTNPLLLTPQDWSFPTKEIAMEEVIDGDINASISWQGTIYYVSETLADLIAAANAGGGGGSSYLSYVPLLSQTTVTQTSGLLEIGKEYSINTLQAGDNFVNVGYVSQATPFVAIGTTPTSWDNETLVRNITDSAPVAEVFTNTIGEVEWEALNDKGFYYLESDGLFPVGKVYIPPFGNFQDSGVPFIPIFTNGTIIGYYSMYEAANNNWIYLQCVDANFVGKDLSELIGSGKLYLPEIRIYP